MRNAINALPLWGTWLHGFGPEDMTDTSRGILKAIGSPYASLRLDAPLDAAPVEPDDTAPPDRLATSCDRHSAAASNAHFSRSDRCSSN